MHENQMLSLQTFFFCHFSLSMKANMSNQSHELDHVTFKQVRSRIGFDLHNMTAVHSLLSYLCFESSYCLNMNSIFIFFYSVTVQTLLCNVLCFLFVLSQCAVTLCHCTVLFFCWSVCSVFPFLLSPFWMFPVWSLVILQAFPTPCPKKAHKYWNGFGSRKHWNSTNWVKLHLWK